MDPAAEIRQLVTLPRTEQPDAVRELLARWPPVVAGEAWNAAFGEGSLFRAFTRSTVARGVYAANRAFLWPYLQWRPGFVAVEVGGGDGTLWETAPALDGEIVVVDPHPTGADGVRRAVAARRDAAPCAVRHVAVPVQSAVLPDADVVVCSLTLHHVAGEDTKRGILRRFRDAVALRDGRVLLNEADVYCDTRLLPGDPLLAERIVDSYVRRFAISLLDDVRDRTDADDDLRARWLAIVRDWSLGQLGVADAPIDQRDVYELDVQSWLRLIDDAGLRVETRGFTDRYGLFHRYVLAPA